MASSVHPFFPVAIDPNVVANAFVVQYYHILYDKPEFLHQFYQNYSRIGRPGPDEKMLVFTTLPQAIHENLLLLAYGDFRAAEITTVDSQESYNGGVLVVVTGYFPFHEKKIKRKFIQTFFLAPQENGYFVLNDIFRLVDEPPKTKDGDIVAGLSSESPIPPPAVPTEGDNAPEQTASTWVNPDDEETIKPDNGNAPAVEEIPPAPEIINAVPELEITCDEVTDDSQKVSEQENGPQDIPKISYASVVMKEKTGVSASPLPLPKPVSRDQDQQVASDPPAVMKEKIGVLASPSPPPEPVSQNQTQPVASDRPVMIKQKTGVLTSPSPLPKPVSQEQDQQVASDRPVVKSDSVTVASDVIGNVDNQDGVAAEGASIYVKGLPPNATHALLENEFKKFGTIRNGGIQVINQWGFAYGFVEFGEADSAQRAIEASPVIIGGRKSMVEEKRSTSRGNRGRSSSGSGNVYRSEGVRGRGGGGGRGGYGRGEYGNNRGGGRRGNGYQRTEGGGGRMNRGAYVSVNNTTKPTMESDVPASG